jgi:hypothetical protein
MKCTLLREMQSPNPAFSWDDFEAARNAGQEYSEHREFTRPAGYVIDDPDAWRLVRIGVAIPHDDACRTAAGMTESQMQEAQARYSKLANGIAVFKPESEPIDVE